MNMALKLQTGVEVRRLVRAGEFTGQTAGQAPDHLQGNVVILPRTYASDFLQYCLNNPKPCPLIGLSKPGDPAVPALGPDIDIRFDVPRYRVYRDGALADETTSVEALWREDLVTFVLGCSFTFEDALIRAGYGVRHIDAGQNVPMFRSGIETLAGGIFKGPLVVTMRPYPEDRIPDVFDICARYPQAHGTPVHWGDPAAIGIADLDAPDYGDPVEMRDNEIPVFWACGVTPQAAIEAARPSLTITHAPGHMLVTDIPADQSLQTITGMKNFRTQTIEI